MNTKTSSGQLPTTPDYVIESLRSYAPGRCMGSRRRGGTRLQAFRKILCELVSGNISQEEGIRRVETELCREQSFHRDNNKVFCHDWAERLIRTQLSRFYNQAVLELLRDKGETEVIVPNSSAEDPSSPCSQHLAGRSHEIQFLLSRLLESYELGQWNSDPKIPNHPHCTHVVRPLGKFIEAN